MKKVIVFGGLGFLGSHTAKHLKKLGFNVSIFDFNKTNDSNSDQNIIRGDINDINSVDKAIKGQDIVYHFAAIADISEAKENPIRTANFNIIGTLNILESCVKHKIERFIFSSSIYVYSDHGSFYRTTKQACELFIQNYSNEFSLDFTILRYGSIYGLNANKFNFISSAIKEALTTGQINRKGSGDESRDYINVTDAAKLSCEIISKKYINKFIMITGSQTRKVKEVLSMIKEMFGNKIKINYLKNKSYDAHYTLTPYSFKPQVAQKLIPNEFQDLGQGILSCIHYEYSELVKKGVNIKNIYNK